MNRMLKKIISGGQTGADQAALDAAIEFGIPHGGWVPRGRMTEDGRLPDIYRLQEISSISYDQRAEMNIVDSDGTLVVSHGKLTDEPALTQRLAYKHRKPCLCVDIAGFDTATASGIIFSWIEAREIRTLNVTGPRASKDPKIYPETKALIEAVILRGLPKTVEEAVERIESEISLRDKTRISAMHQDDLHLLNHTVGAYIRRSFGLNSGNRELMEACCRAEGKSELSTGGASLLIIRNLWKKLKVSHSIRAVK